MVSQSHHHRRLGQSPVAGVRLAGLVAVVCAILVAGFSNWTLGQTQRETDPKVQDGLVIRVPNPITSAAVKRIERQINYAVGRKQHKISAIVFMFQKPDEVAGTTDFHPCNELQDYITSLNRGTVKPELKGVTTIAFLQGGTTRHTVWPVLACQQIAMRDSATVNTIIGPGQKFADLTKAAQDAYNAKKNEAGWRGILDKLLHEDSKIGPIGLTRLDLKHELAKVSVDVTHRESIQDIRAKAGLAKLSTQNYRLADIKTPVTWLVELSGPVNKANMASLRRRIQQGIQQGANLFVLKLDSPEGETAPAANFVESHLKHWRDAKDVGRTIGFIAYVPPNRNLGAATYVALACDDIVLGRGASLADFSHLSGKSDEYLSEARRQLVSLARQHQRSPALFLASMTRGLQISKIKQTEDSSWDIVTKAKADKATGVHDKRSLGSPGEFLVIDEQLASESGVADVIGVKSLEEVYAKYGIDPQTVKVAEKDWLDQVAEFFRNGWVRFFLLMVALTALILELKVPGFGLPGIVAAVCFVLLFWAHWSVGQFAVLSLFLFVLGLALLAVEIFVIPGFGITGISGIGLAVLSLVLMTIESMPNSAADWMSLGTTFSSVILSIVGAVVFAMAFASLLPHIPYANRLLLVPPGEGDEDGAANAGQQNVRLLGAIGLAETPLRPSGKAKFEGQYYDVLSDGEFIPPGSRVQVVEVEGNRIVVKLV